MAKGQALIITSLILSTVLLVAMDWAIVSVMKVKESIGISESIKALYAADSGVDCELYNKLVAGWPVPPIDCVGNSSQMTNNTTFENMGYTFDPATGKSTLDERGVSNSTGVTRAIRLTF